MPSKYKVTIELEDNDRGTISLSMKTDPPVPEGAPDTPVLVAASDTYFFLQRRFKKLQDEKEQSAKSP